MAKAVHVSTVQATIRRAIVLTRLTPVKAAHLWLREAVR